MGVQRTVMVSAVRRRINGCLPGFRVCNRVVGLRTVRLHVDKSAVGAISPSLTGDTGPAPHDTLSVRSLVTWFLSP